MLSFLRVRRAGACHRMLGLIGRGGMGEVIPPAEVGVTEPL